MRPTSLLVKLAIPAVLLSACASGAPPDPEAAKQASVVCTRETPTGSAFPVTKCRTKGQIEKTRETVKTKDDEVTRVLTEQRGTATNNP